MPSGTHELPDLIKLLTFTTDQHPDFQGTTIHIENVLSADIPSYIVTANNVSMSDTNILTVFNKANRRVRIQRVYIYVSTPSSTNQGKFELNYINTEPTGGTNAVISKISADFASPPSAPDNFVALVNATATPASGPDGTFLLGGAFIDFDNTYGQVDIFKKDANYSSIQLRPQSAPGVGQDGLLLRKVAAADTTGNVTAVMIITLD